MEKVKLTNKQAESLERGIGIYGKSRMMNDHEPDGWTGIFSHLNGFTKDEIARALYIGYEVEPEFKVGELIHVNWKNPRLTIDNIYEIERVLENGQVVIDNVTNPMPHMDIVRHATPEEEATYKSVNWWAKHDRDVWKLEEDDELIKRVRPATFRVIEQDEHETTVFELNRTETGYIKIKNEHLERNYNIKFFSEDRKDI